MRTRAIAGPSLLVALAAFSFAAGCGDDNGTTTSTPTSTTAEQTAVRSIEIKMGEYFFDPKDATVTAGNVKITAPNTGKVLHELVLFKTDKDPGSFETSGGEVDEEAVEASGAKSPGEIPDVEPGKTKSATLKLTAGKYAMICNIPGHYAQGMYGSLTAK